MYWRGASKTVLHYDIHRNSDDGSTLRGSRNKRLRGSNGERGQLLPEEFCNLARVRLDFARASFQAPKLDRGQSEIIRNVIAYGVRSSAFPVDDPLID